MQQLSSNAAGLSFLALAATLTSTMTGADAASAVQRTLYTSSSDKSQVPPEHHVEAVLTLLDPQLSSLGFQDKCYKWDQWLKDQALLSHSHSLQYPSPSGLERIVSAMRTVARIGDENADTVVFTCYSCTIWFYCFH